MAIETLNYATEYMQALDQIFPYALNFGDLYATPNNGRYSMIMSGSQKHWIISGSGKHSYTQ